MLNKDWAWTDRHESMMDKQKKKASKRHVHAILEGQIESSEGWQEKVEGAIKRRKDNAKQLKQEKQRIEKVIGKKDDMQFANKKLHIASAADTPELRQGLASHPGASVVSSRQEADVFVVLDPAKASDKTKWCAILLGCSIVTPGCVLNGHGAALAYKPSIATLRHLYISEGFQEAHASFAKLLVSAAKQHGSKWKILGSAQSFVAAFEKAKKNHRPATVVTLVGVDESFDPPLPARARIFRDVDSFLETVTKYDCSQSSAGVAKR